MIDVDIDNAKRLSSITDKEFERIQTLVYDRLGINLTEKKRSLVVGRLQKLVRERQFDNFDAYFDHLVADKTGKELSQLADRISTNHTFFYRESSHFDHFVKEVLPETLSRIEETGQKDLRIWCAGCSTGEEPYTLVILMMEALGLDYSSWNAGVLATDVSERVLDIAKRGVYAAENVENMPKSWQQRYFSQVGDDYAVKDMVKKEVVFRRFNLINERFPFKKPFHIVFCRNVMIYFDVPTRGALIGRFYNVTESGGYLFVGHAESLRNNEMGYEYVMPAVYRKPSQRSEI